MVDTSLSKEHHILRNFRNRRASRVRRDESRNPHTVESQQGQRGDGVANWTKAVRPHVRLNELFGLQVLSRACSDDASKGYAGLDNRGNAFQCLTSRSREASRA